jgi:SagB-type dehydrogenase family enzyme
VAEEYHHLTKYDEQSVRAGPGLDMASQPSTVKEIVSSHRVSLRRFLPFRGGAREAVPPLAEGEAPGIAHLSRLLFFSNGVTGIVRYPQGASRMLRASPSAGALYPTEIYVATRAIHGLEAGLYNYQVPGHELVRLWEGDQLDEIRRACGDDPRFEHANYCILLTGLYWRSAWRYRERGYRRVLLDTGHVLANLAAYAACEHCRVHPMPGFLDAALNGLFFFDDAVEGTLVCAPVTQAGVEAPGAPLWTSASAVAEEIDAAELTDPRELTQSATVALHRKSSCAEPTPVASAPGLGAATARAIPLEAPGELTDTLPQTILHRRSARSYSAENPIDLVSLGRALGFALGHTPEPDTPSPCREAGILRAHVAALNVDGLDAGLYEVEGAGEALLPIAMGDLRPKLFHVSLGQEIARDAAAVLILSAPARTALELFGERVYRYLHLEAGVIGQRFQLAAGALDLKGCGIGGFYDDETSRLVDLTPRDWILYLVTVGKS